jgi:GDPmannose 4,6-dehydratase
MDNNKIETRECNNFIIVTGANGQGAQYFIKYLQETQPNLKIIATLRHKTSRKENYIFDTNKVVFELMDLSDGTSIENIITKYKPDYFINYAANAFVGESWTVPEQHFSINTLSVLRMMECIRKYSPHTRYYSSGSSEEFAISQVTKAQNESTLISPRSPYGISKASARYIVKVWRESYNLYAVQGYTFNFESPLRDEKYLPRKVSKGVARIKYALDNNLSFEPLELGNIESFRSWQHASDVGDGIWRMMNQDFYNKNFDGIVKDYVLSAMDTHKVRELVELAFKEAGIDGMWAWKFGEPMTPENEMFVEKTTDLILVKINPKFYRPLDVTYLHGDSSLIQKELGWKITKSFEDIVKEMVEWDIKNYNK